MFSMKKMAVIALLLIGIVCAASPATATKMNYDVDVTISNLGANNLAGFQLDLNYDDSLLTYANYDLTDELGTFTGAFPDAEDWSTGDDGAGTVSFDVVSYLFDFSSQSDGFTLATVHFTGEASALAGFSLSNILLSDEFGGGIPLTAVSFAVDATDINAVPLPGPIWLLGTGLVGLVGLRKRVR